MYILIFTLFISIIHSTVSSTTTDYCLSLPQEEFKKHIFKQFELPDGRRVLILDRIIQEERLILLRNYMNVNDHWRFVLFDEHAKSNGTQVKYDSGNGIPWKSWQDPTLLSTTKVGFTLKNIVNAAHLLSTGKNDTAYEMTEMYASIMRRGDRPIPYIEEKEREMGYSIAIYNNVVWRKNDYGEMLFYDENDEIFAIVRPVFGRVIIWDSSIKYMSRTPSMKQILGQNVIYAHFSSCKNKIREKREYFRNFLLELKNVQRREFVASKNDDSSMTTDVAPHLSLLRENYKGYKVAVFDHLFSKEDLDAIRTWTIKYGRYFYEDDFDATSDNVHWIAGINVDKFAKSRFWPVIKKVAAFVSGNDSWYPYDVACNLIRTTDHTRFHLDTSYPGEKEMTFLLYLSPNWTAADYGETAFMEKNNDAEDNEYVAEVVPMYGRAVIFDGNFPHSARPPSVMHYGPRYTLAVKLSENKWEAVKKTFSEESRHEGGMASSLNLGSQLTKHKKYFIASHKIQAVVQYFKIVHLQDLLSRPVVNLNAPQEENEEQKGEGKSGEGDGERDNEEGEDEDGDDEEDVQFTAQEQEMLEDFVGESEVELPKKYLKYILKMIRYHFSDMQSDQPDTEEDDHGFDVPENAKFKQIFDYERRQKIIEGWIKISENNPEVLNDYLQLMLDQQTWLKSEVTYKMLGYF